MCGNRDGNDDDRSDSEDDSSASPSSHGDEEDLEAGNIPVYIRESLILTGRSRARRH